MTPAHRRDLHRAIRRLEALRQAHLDHGRTSQALDATRRIQTAKKQLEGRR